MQHVCHKAKVVSRSITCLPHASATKNSQEDSRVPQPWAKQLGHYKAKTYSTDNSTTLPMILPRNSLRVLYNSIKILRQRTSGYESIQKSHAQVKVGRLGTLLSGIRLIHKSLHCTCAIIRFTVQTRYCSSQRRKKKETHCRFSGRAYLSQARIKVLYSGAVWFSQLLRNKVLVQLTRSLFDGFLLSRIQKPSSFQPLPEKLGLPNVQRVLRATTANSGVGDPLRSLLSYPVSTAMCFGKSDFWWPTESRDVPQNQ